MAQTIGNTTFLLASQAEHEDSIPFTCSKIKGTTYCRAFYFGFRRPEGGSTLRRLKCSEWQSHPCAEVLPAAKCSSAAKAARPRRAGGQDLRWSIQNLKYLDCSDLPCRRGLHIVRDGFFTKVIACSFRRSSSPNQTRFAGLWFAALRAALLLDLCVFFVNTCQKERHDKSVSFFWGSGR